MTRGSEMSSSAREHPPVPNRSLTANIAQFGEYLKRGGILISLGEMLDAAKTAKEIPILDRMTFYFALRTALVKSPDLFARYDFLFRQFWSTDRLDLEPRDVSFSLKTRRELERDRPEIDFVDMSQNDKEEQKEIENSKNFAIYSPVARTTQRKFKPIFSYEKISRTKRLIRRFKRRFATRRGRRIITSNAGQIDLRRSMRKSVSRGGSVIFLARSEKKITRSKIIALADVSGSMDEQSEEIYLILYLLKNILTNSELFIFSTELVRLTNLFNFNNFRETADRISNRIQIWGSGTRIGECFQRFLEKHSSLVDKNTTIVIISDGWDLGDPEILNESMYLLRSKCHMIIWLNPYAKTKGYEPSCTGMKTALPYVDVFTSPEVFANKTLFEEYFGKETSPWAQTTMPVRKKAISS